MGHYYDQWQCFLKVDTREMMVDRLEELVRDHPDIIHEPDKEGLTPVHIQYLVRSQECLQRCSITSNIDIILLLTPLTSN